MILVDTNIIIDYLKGNESILSDLIEEDNLAICGIILAELLHGIQSEKDRGLVDDAINDFEWIPIHDTIWYPFGSNLNLLRKNGLTIPFQDVLLATLCIEKDLQIATKDKHFKDIASILTNLNLHNSL